MKTKQIRPRKCMNCIFCSLCLDNIMYEQLYYTYDKLYGHKDCTSLTLDKGVVTYRAKGRTVKRKMSKSLESIILKFVTRKV